MFFSPLYSLTIANVGLETLLILNFSQKVPDDVMQMAKEKGVEILSNDVIYGLVDSGVKWIEEKDKDVRRQRMEE